MFIKADGRYIDSRHIVEFSIEDMGALDMRLSGHYMIVATSADSARKYELNGFEDEAEARRTLQYLITILSKGGGLCDLDQFIAGNNKAKKERMKKS